MQISTPSSSLKCPTCKLYFNEQQLHKQHYKSDFHRYNLKRSMVNLPPATLEQFSTKRSEVKNQRQTNFQCRECRKTFASAQTLNQHALTKKHDINMLQPQKSQKLIEHKPKVFKKDEKLCLFCFKQSESLDLSLQHMRIEHSFFISQQIYCVDKAKLILYLQEKIEVGMMCILCDNKGAKDFASGEAVRNHMLSKNHTFMNTQKGFEEYEDFYDFSSLFKQKLEQQKAYANPLGINFQKVKVIVDKKKQLQQKNGSKVNIKKEMINQSEKEDGGQIENQNREWDDIQDEGQDGEQWEDQSEQQQNQGIEQENEYQNQNEQQMKETKKKKVRTYQIMIPTLTSTDQLLLPNGRVLGHRKYRHIYRQALKINNWFENTNQKMLESGASQHALVLRNTLLQLIKKERVMKNLNRRQDKKYVKSGIQNSNLFRHFRSSNPL